MAHNGVFYFVIVYIIYKEIKVIAHYELHVLRFICFNKPCLAILFFCNLLLSQFIFIRSVYDIFIHKLNVWQVICLVIL